MPKQYPKQVRDRAVRLVLDHLSEYDTLYLACKTIAPKVGVGCETLRRWVRQAQVDAGVQPGTTSNEQARLKELEREVRELREANEILKAASIFFAGELDPDAVDRRVHRATGSMRSPDLHGVQVLAEFGVVFSERAFRKARSRPASVRDVTDAVVVEALLATRRLNPVSGRAPRERFYGRRKRNPALDRIGWRFLRQRVDGIDQRPVQERMHQARRTDQVPGPGRVPHR